MWYRLAACDDQGHYLGGAGPVERLCAGFEGRAGGHDGVNEAVALGWGLLNA